MNHPLSCPHGILEAGFKTFRENQTKIKFSREGSIFVFHDYQNAYENLRVMLPYYSENNI